MLYLNEGGRSSRSEMKNKKKNHRWVADAETWHKSNFDGGAPGMFKLKLTGLIRCATARVPFTKALLLYSSSLNMRSARAKNMMDYKLLK